MWEKSPDIETDNWIAAKYQCLAKRIGGQMGWRLLALAELASLFDLKAVSLSMISPGPPPFFINSQHIQQRDFPLLIRNNLRGESSTSVEFLFRL